MCRVARRASCVCSRFQTVLFVVILLRALGYAESKAPVRSQIHELLAAAHASGEFSGIVAVRQHGATVFQESFGYADYENSLAITSDARFEIASATKTFTASGILLLRDRGRLTLDDPVSRYFPDFPNGDHITIKNLLSRTSGFGELPSTAITEDESLPDVVAAIGKQPVYFAPGSSDRYSNSGYVLLAAIIEKAAGEHYQTFVERELFSRAGMTRTRNYSVSEIVAGRTRKYRPGPPPALVWNVPSRSLSSTMVAGSASFTATDLLLGLAAIRNQKIFEPRDPYGWGRRNYFEHNRR